MMDTFLDPSLWPAITRGSVLLTLGHNQAGHVPLAPPFLGSCWAVTGLGKSPSPLHAPHRHSSGAIMGLKNCPAITIQQPSHCQARWAPQDSHILWIVQGWNVDGQVSWTLSLSHSGGSTSRPGKCPEPCPPCRATGGYRQHTEGMPIECVALVNRGNCVSGLHKAASTRDHSFKTEGGSHFT